MVAGPVRRNAAAEAVTAQSAAAVTAADERIAAVTQYLSSDELEGRGIDTKGLDQAADYIAKQFADLGLKTRLFDDSPFQRFSVTTGANLGEKNELEFFGPTIDGESTEAVKQSPARISRRWPSAARANSICRWYLSAMASRPKPKATTTTPGST